MTAPAAVTVERAATLLGADRRDVPLGPLCKWLRVSWR
jgi:hypothetical protein